MAAIVLFFSLPTAAAAPIVPPEAQNLAPVERSYTKGELMRMAENIATQRGIEPSLFKAVIGCESRWNPKAIGDNGLSHGLAQFHRPVRDWGITIEQAQDPEFALNLMAKAWKGGKQRKWTCFRILTS